MSCVLKTEYVRVRFPPLSTESQAVDHEPDNNYPVKSDQLEPMSIGGLADAFYSFFSFCVVLFLLDDQGVRLGEGEALLVGLFSCQLVSVAAKPASPTTCPPLQCYANGLSMYFFCRGEQKKGQSKTLLYLVSGLC